MRWAADIDLCMTSTLLISRDPATWAEANKTILSALTTVADLIGLRSDEVAEASGNTVSALLDNDCALLRRVRPTKERAFIKAVAVNNGRAIVRARRRYQRRFITMSEQDLELTESLN